MSKKMPFDLELLCLRQNSVRLIHRDDHLVKVSIQLHSEAALRRRKKQNRKDLHPLRIRNII